MTSSGVSPTRLPLHGALAEWQRNHGDGEQTYGWQNALMPMTAWALTGRKYLWCRKHLQGKPTNSALPSAVDYFNILWPCFSWDGKYLQRFHCLGWKVTASVVHCYPPLSSSNGPSYKRYCTSSHRVRSTCWLSIRRFGLKDIWIGCNS